MFAPKVLDGTRCKSGVLDMCVNGKCWPVGCDKVLGSRLKMDSCGKCGGTNTCLRNRRKNKSNRFKWISTGFGPCSTSCGVGHQDIVIVCKDLRTGRTVSNRRCMKTERPDRYRRKCIVRKCRPSWFVGPWNECTQTCGGGYAWRIVRCIESFIDGTKNAVNDSQCSEFKPSERKTCGNEICPRWYAGQWSPCSVTCGTGHQQRDVICRNIGNAECNETYKPKLYKNCTIIPCDMQADVQEVMVVNPDEEKSSVSDVLYDENVQEENLQTPRYVVSQWGQCSTTCGVGIKRRYVRCKVYLPFLGALADLPDEDCKDDKPADSQPCFLGHCLADFEYRAIGLTPCSRSCIGGVQETIMKCVHKSNGSVVDDELCEEAQLIPIERRVCNDNPCPQRWQVGDFGECSKSCGNGVMTRNVKCIQEFSVGPENILRLPDFMCEQPVPQRERNCNRIECPSKWSFEEWTPVRH
ncbi:hypothetical protein KUTeg_018340 [Tegillarca granosa]|uniref:Uncharacterized protein n=1 Tax=Tegillarca granosa TaxID=220873 RepID=A0ABQ9ELG9_TEGGR|nr:hypothetical protein KUTeg_018340 [Tegillarca granosa]